MIEIKFNINVIKIRLDDNFTEIYLITITAVYILFVNSFILKLSTLCGKIKDVD